MNDTLVYKIAFASIRGMGIDLARKFLEVIPNEKDFFDISEKELRELTCSKARMCDYDYRHGVLEKAKHELEFVLNKNINVTYFTDTDYPQRLLEASDAPLLLYCSGKCNLNAAHVISIVGTRHATPAGIKMCDDIVNTLSIKLDNIVVVSGLAYGIDIAAHRASLKHNVPTVAVMAQGLNKIYPSTHRNDAISIIKQGGAILTDYQSQDEIHKGNFLARNRIIAALSDCTVVVESADTGGALVTASLAQSYNRDVFAVPGRTGDEFSKGCNRLIRDNRAMLITGADDIIDAMRWQTKVSTPVQKEIFPILTADEKKIVDALKTSENMHINDLATKLQMPIYKLMGALVELDCRGFIVTLPGCRYAIR